MSRSTGKRDSFSHRLKALNGSKKNVVRKGPCPGVDITMIMEAVKPCLL
jgi:hypothetical protein